MKSFGLIIRILSVLLIVILVSCKKEPKKIGLDIQPPDDKFLVSYSDTTSIFTHSVREDSVRTDEISISLLGSLYDPVFGKTTSSIATQLTLSKSGIDFGSNPQVDSLILSLVYVGYYGDTNSSQTLRVYELDEDIIRDSTYYSNKRVQHTDIDLAHYTFMPRPTDSLEVDGITESPQIKVNLSAISPILAEKILYAPADILADNDKFLEYFKGLYITTDPLSYGGAILYLNIISATSSMVLYYSNDSLDSQSYELLINENCTRFNEYDHYNYDYADQEFRKQVIYNDTILGGNEIYAQAMGGVKSRIRFPYLKNFANTSKIAVNEAVLYIYNNNPGTEFKEVVTLNLFRLDEDEDLVFLPDYLEGLDYFGGSYDEGSASYKFRLTRFVQAVLNDEYTDPVLSLSVSGASSISNRIILNGPKYPINRMRLEIIYTELN